MATMMMKTFVKPTVQVKPGSSTGRGPVSTSVDAEPLVDLSGSEYRLIMHCRGPEAPGQEMTQEQQGISAHSRNHESKP